MALKLVFAGPGKLRSRQWYGVFKVTSTDGQAHRRVLPLGVEVPDGCRVPDSMRANGDSTFERSRGAAQVAHDIMAKKMAEDRVERHTLERIVELKTGSRTSSVLLVKSAPPPTADGTEPAKKSASRKAATDLLTAWENLPGKKSEQYIYEGRNRIKRFTAYLQTRYPHVRELAQITPGMAMAWMKAYETKGVAPKSYNTELTFWRSAFARLTYAAGLAANPFASLSPRKLDTRHKRAFSEKELGHILETAKQTDPDLYPLILTCACTGLRKGDAATLKFRDVDMQRGYIRHPQHKTGDTVEIPLVEPLRGFLKQIEQQDADAFVFPALAAQYENDADRMTRQVQAVLAVSLGYYTPEDKESRTDFMIRVQGDKKNLLRSKAEGTGMRRRNEVGLHAFRTTLASMLLNRGMAAHLVSKITGHAAIETTLKHYHRMDSESLHREMSSRVSAALTGKTKQRPALSAKNTGNTAAKEPLPIWAQDTANRILLALDSGDAATAKMECRAMLEITSKAHPKGRN